MITQDILDYINSKLAPQPSIVLELNLTPTEKNKPSPSSHYTEGELLRYSKSGFPKEVLKYQVSNTNSMEPWIDAGDVILVQPLAANEQPTVGEVYVYKVGDMLVIHRLTRVSGDKYTFRGDNNFRDDLFRPEKSGIVGHVFGVLWGKKQLGD